MKKDGSVWSWGRNTEGQLGDFTNTQHNAAVQTGEKLVKTLSVTEGTIIDSDGNEFAKVDEDELYTLP